MNTREDYLAKLKQKNKEHARVWTQAKQALLDHPELDLGTLKYYQKFKNKSAIGHLQKAKSLLQIVEVGKTYSIENLRAILEEVGYQGGRPGSTLNRVFNTVYDPNSKTYYIINKLNLVD